MNHFYITDDNTLILLDAFVFSEGQSQIVRIPVVGGTTYGRTRKGPDTFRMTMRSPLPQVGQFNVVDENCVVYQCSGTSVTNTSASGVVCDKWEIEAEHKAAAIQAMRDALQQQNGGN